MVLLIIIKKPLIAQKEPKTKAKLFAEKYPRTEILDLEICPENIIVDSPAYIPYKKIPINQKGKGKYGKKPTFPMSLDSEMGAHHKQTPTQRDLENAARARRLSGKGSVPHKIPLGGKVPRAPLAAKAPHKCSGTSTPVTGGIKKPKKHKPGVIALHEIQCFQKSINLLIPLLSFGHVVHEVAQDFKVDLRFQSSALMVIQEAAEAYFVNLFEAANLCAIHRN